MTTPPAAAAATTAASGPIWVNVSINGKSTVAGPFNGNAEFVLLQAKINPYPSQKAAAAAKPQVLTAAQVQAFEQAVLMGPGIGQGFFGLASSFPNPLNLLAALSWLEDIGHWLGVFVTAVTDPYTWISLGWGFLGLVLLIIGILWWFKSTEAGQKLGKAATEAAVVAA